MNQTFTFSQGSRVVAYFRDSGGKDQDLSVEQQLDEAGRFCQKSGLVLVRTFADAARSGRRVVGRDQFLEMIDYLTREGHTEAGVLFWNYDRLARDYDDSSYYIALLRRFGLQVHSLTDNIPPGLEGRLFEAILNYKAAKFSEDLSKNVKRGMKHLVTAYKAWPTSTPPTGYIRVPEEIGKRRDGSAHIIYHLQPDPKIAPLVTLAFQMRARMSDYREIHTATGLFTTKTGYSNLLRKSIYTGTFIYRGEEFPDFCPPLIDLDTWQEVQKINAAWTQRTGVFSPRGSNSSYLLTGLIYCKQCGSMMYGVSVKGKWFYYRCFGENNGLTRCTTRQIPRDRLETWVIQRLRDRLTDPDWLGSIAAQQSTVLTEQVHDLVTRLEQTRARLTENQRAITRIVSAIREIGHSQALISELQELEKETTQLEIDRDRLEMEQRKATDQVGELSGEEIAAAAKVYLEELENGDFQEKRRRIRGMISQVTAERVTNHIVGEIVLYLPGLKGIKI